jgi:CHASE3 domain sensor protein
MAYLISGEESDLSEYQTAASQISEPMGRLRELTKDNPIQVDNCARLDSETTARVQAWQASIEEKRKAKAVDLSSFMRQNMAFSSREAVITAAIRSEEKRLLD